MRSIGGLLSIGRRPPLFDLAERRRVEVVELVPALSPGPDEPSLLEDVEVLRDRLAGRSEAVVADQPDAELEQRLAIALLQLIEDRPAGRVGQGLVEIAHHADDRQAQTCVSTSRAGQQTGSTRITYGCRSTGTQMGPTRLAAMSFTSRTTSDGANLSQPRRSF